MNTISAGEAANRTRRALALRDLLLEVGWDADKAAQLGDDGWDALARTLAARTRRPFRTPSPETRRQAIGLLRGALTVVPVAMPAADRPMPAPAPSVTAEDLARVGRGSDVDRLGLKRVPTNVSLMVD